MSGLLLAFILVFAVLAGLAVVLLGRMVFSGTGTFVKTKAKTVNAVILDKRKQEMLRRSGPYTNYFILFGLGDDDKMELPVSKKLYRGNNIGQSGILTYRGGIFVSFIEDTKKKENSAQA